MANECKVIYAGEKGFLTFDGKKTVFQHRDSDVSVKAGLGEIVEGTIDDKGNYAFAVLRNIETVLPDNYKTLNFFNNRGVPMRVHRGMYGDNVILKEFYKDKTYIRAYSPDGQVLLYEGEIIRTQQYEGPNIYFTRLDELVGEWDDITEEIEKQVICDLDSKKTDISLSNERVIQALKGLSKNQIVQLESGVILADGKYESLVIWEEDDEIKMVWLGRKLDLACYTYTDIVDKVLNLINI